MGATHATLLPTTQCGRACVIAPIATSKFEAHGDDRSCPAFHAERSAGVRARTGHAQRLAARFADRRFRGGEQIF
jgi:hypothetical protein